MAKRPEFCNLFDGLPEPGETRDAEEFQDLLKSPGVRIERIVSTGQATPEGQWYDQDRGEWVALLKGRARLSFEGEDAPRDLGAGDCVYIPPHVRHRVDWTDPVEPAVWLAVWIAADDRET